MLVENRITSNLLLLATGDRLIVGLPRRDLQIGQQFERFGRQREQRRYVTHNDNSHQHCMRVVRAAEL